MCFIRAGFLAAAVCLLAGAADSSPLREHQDRRAELLKTLGNGVVVLFGATEDERGNLRGGFFQEPNFFYLTGWEEPGAVLLMVQTPESSSETLFLPSRNPEAEKWTGKKAAAEDQGVSGLTGFDRVLQAESFESELRKALEQAARIYTMLGSPLAERLRQLAPLRELDGLAQPIAKLRMTKSPRELELIRRAARETMAAHRAAFGAVRPGAAEYQVAASMAATYQIAGCERPAYSPIVASGPNATVLHYSRNRRKMNAGDLVVIDVGAECANYAADITRTLPVTGKFTPRQREIYEIVLGAQKAAIAAAKPGMTIGRQTPDSLYQIAHDYIDSHGKDLEGNSLGRYFTHGVSHHIGLEVHDAADPNAPLAPGMVITVEPGIYIPEEQIGIRIEDMVLVTEDGAEVLTRDLPKTVEEIERAIAR